MSLHIRHARPSDAKILVKSMRARDVEEVLAGWGDPEEAILSAINTSPYARTAFWELEPLAIYGMQSLTVLGGSAQVWCFGAAAIDRHRLTFLRASKAALKDMFERAPILTNYVDATDFDAIRWLSWLGARSALPPQMRGGRLFAQFFLERPTLKGRTCQQG